MTWPTTVLGRQPRRHHPSPEVAVGDDAGRGAVHAEHDHRSDTPSGHQLGHRGHRDARRAGHRRALDQIAHVTQEQTHLAAIAGRGLERQRAAMTGHQRARNEPGAGRLHGDDRAGGRQAGRPGVEDVTRPQGVRGSFALQPRAGHADRSRLDDPEPVRRGVPLGQDPGAGRPLLGARAGRERGPRGLVEVGATRQPREERVEIGVHGGSGPARARRRGRGTAASAAPTRPGPRRPPRSSRSRGPARAAGGP